MFPTDWHRKLLLDLVHDAEGRDSVDPDRLEDIAHWTRLGAQAESATEGIPESAFGPCKRDGGAPVRDFAGRRPVTDQMVLRIGHGPQGPQTPRRPVQEVLEFG